MELSERKKDWGFLYALISGGPTLTLNGLLVMAAYRNINAGANTINGQDGFTRREAGPTGPGNGALIVTISGPTIGLPFQPLNFSATVSGGTPPYSYTWSWGDGGHSTGQNVTHSWFLPGTYTVTVAVRDSAGNGGQAVLHITI